MPAKPGQQKKIARRKKKREQAHRRPASHPGPSFDAFVRMAAALPDGPSYVSADFTKTDKGPPRFVSVVVTHIMPDGQLLPALALVDRGCLGVKNAFVAEPVTRDGLQAFLAEAGRAHEGGLAPCEHDVALSIVWSAVDYAASLGFDPHPDFPAPLFGPRPSPLRDTPFARPARPFYVRGPHDDVEAILETLDEAVGRGNYDFVMGEKQGGS